MKLWVIVASEELDDEPFSFVAVKDYISLEDAEELALDYAVNEMGREDFELNIEIIECYSVEEVGDYLIKLEEL